MKQCAYCGKDNADDAVSCRECGTNEFKSTVSAEAECRPDAEPHVVTLTGCSTLMEADLIVSRLESAGIHAFIPDQFLMQNITWNPNPYGFVRIQVSSEDLEAAKEILSSPGLDAEQDQSG